MNTVISNYPFSSLQPFLLPLKCSLTQKNFKNTNQLYQYILTEKDLKTIMKEDVYSRGTVLEKMEKLLTMSPGKEYDALYQEIIAVGEYTIQP
jgi:hypothetical protein